MKLFYYTNGSFLANLNPLSKLLTPMPVFILLAVINDIWTPLFFIFLTTIILLFLGKIPIKNYLKMAIPILLFSFSILILFLFAAKKEVITGSPILFSIGSFNVYQESLSVGLIIALRLFALMIIWMPFSLTTEPSDLIRSLTQNLKMPYRFCYAVMTGFRFIPMMENEFQTIRSAHKVMGISEKSGILSNFKKTKRYSIPILVNAIRIGERTALSMDGRAFGAFEERTFYKSMYFKRADWIYMSIYWVISALILVILQYAGLMGEIHIFHGFG